MNPLLKTSLVSLIKKIKNSLVGVAFNVTVDKKQKVITVNLPI